MRWSEIWIKLDLFEGWLWWEFNQDQKDNQLRCVVTDETLDTCLWSEMQEGEGLTIFYICLFVEKIILNALLEISKKRSQILTYTNTNMFWHVNIIFSIISRFLCPQDGCVYNNEIENWHKSCSVVKNQFDYKNRLNVKYLCVFTMIFLQKWYFDNNIET